MLEAINRKLELFKVKKDLGWPSLTGDCTPSASDLDSECERSLNGLEYWRGIKSRYSTNPAPSDYRAAIDKLPSNWTVITIAITEDRNSLLISRQRPNRDPLIFCIPLERHGRKDEGEEDQQLSYADAMNELGDIVATSNAQAQNAKLVTDKEGQKAWWAERGAVDARLKALLENIEFCWLGAFKVGHPFLLSHHGADYFGISDRPR
jgi:separase